MKLTESNLYIQPHGKDNFVICIALPDNSRNFIHCQSMILGDCINILDDLIGVDIPSDANAPYLDLDGTYYRVKMTIQSDNFSFSSYLHFHSRKLNLNDAVKERQMLLQPTNETNCTEGKN